MAYIYQADLWCDDCGSKICERLVKEGKAQEVIPWDELREDASDSEESIALVNEASDGDSEALARLWNDFQLDPQYSKANLDETLYDSDDYPKHVGDPGESDSPSHCAAGAECLNAEHIDARGSSSRYGRHGSEFKIGALLSTSLTSDGVAYVLERLRGNWDHKSTNLRAESIRLSELAREERSPVVLFWMAHLDGVDWPKDLYTVKLENSGDDPTQVNAYVHGPYADEWCDSVGALTGSSWECADGPEFCYDSFTWEPGLVEGLQKEGFDLDMSEYSDPDSEQLLIARHAYECKACDYDYRRAAEHLEGRILWRLPMAPNLDGFSSAWDAIQCARQRRLDLVTDEQGETYHTTVEPEAYEAPSPSVLSFRKSAHAWFALYVQPRFSFTGFDPFDPTYPHR